MVSKSLIQLNALGQSIWYDNIERRLLDNGELAGMIKQGDITGITSNPTIFFNAITKSSDYDRFLKPMAWSGWTSEKIFDHLAIEDIKQAADLFLPIYEQTHFMDGYVSLEVNPQLAHDTSGTLSETIRLWNLVNRPNVMIKIPATKEGIPAITQAIRAGINVNVTLIFSINRYQEVIEAYINGLEIRVVEGHSIERVSSVASFFISRIDTKLDSILQSLSRNNPLISNRALGLSGKAAIANARLAYGVFQKNFVSERFEKLKLLGAKLQRPLWASTGTKNPNYSDILYIDELIGPDTVNTVPPHTLEAYKHHGKPSLTLAGKENISRNVINDIENLGISLEQVTDNLETEGVTAFFDSYSLLLKAIEDRCLAFRSELGSLMLVVPKRIIKLDENQTVNRIWKHDPTLWTNDNAAQKEILTRMGWLDAPTRSLELVSKINLFISEINKAGFTHALLLGMGGSSLAPEVFTSIFGKSNLESKTGISFSVLDSTDPGQIAAAEKINPIDKTLFIISSKSGSTSEVNALFNYFWSKCVEKFGDQAGNYFIAITDPDSSLNRTARDKKFRKIFSADPNVGGRFSALIAFGLIPASLIGINVSLLLKNAINLAAICGIDYPAGSNPGLTLGAILAEAVLLGKDKLTILTDPAFMSFGSWLEQLIAESSGKDGKGIIPIDLEPLDETKNYGEDRIFVYFRNCGTLDKFVDQLIKLGHPCISFPLTDTFDLGAEFFRWEFAIAIACSILGVNAFDQPQVQDNKTRTAQKISDFKNNGLLLENKPIWQNDSLEIFSNCSLELKSTSTPNNIIIDYLRQVQHGDYVALNAYLPRNPENINMLQNFRKNIQVQTGCATTLGFGPRFLHSTGQLHKGGPNNGVYIQITSNPLEDILIPDDGITFGILERAQALGDYESLVARSKPVLRVNFIRGESLNLLDY
jgi:transaldolase/glucose-6-phosphate isomerase